MKQVNVSKYLMMFVVCVLFFYTQNTKAIECETGWQSFSFQAVDPNTGCNYAFEFCYICNGAGPSLNGSIRYNDPIPLDDNCGTADYDWANDQIVDQYVNLCQIPPCDQGTLQMTHELPLCRKWIHTAYENPPGTWHINDYKQTCLDSDYLCVTTYEICIDPVTGDWDIDENTITHTISGTPDCLLEQPEIGGPILENWESKCWIDYECPPIFD